VDDDVMFSQSECAESETMRMFFRRVQWIRTTDTQRSDGLDNGSKFAEVSK